MVQNSLLGGAKGTDKQPSESEDREQLVERWNVEGTPFVVVKTGNTYHSTMGKYRMSEALKTKDEAFKSAREITWSKILQVISVMQEAYEINKKETAFANKVNEEAERREKLGHTGRVKENIRNNNLEKSK